MPIPEQDALRAIAVAKANPNDPAVIAKAQALTRAYQAQQEAAGLSMFPEQERRRDEQASTLRSFFTEPNHGLDEDTLVSLNENFRESPDEKFKLFNRKWFEAAGVPRERVEREADELMKIYSEREWGTPSTTHKHFFDRIARDYQTREEVANAAKETSLQNLGVLRSELAFKERFRENSSYVGREQKWDKEFQSLKDRFDQKLAPHRSTVKLLSAALMTKEGVDVEDPTTMDEALAQRREIDNAASYRELAEMVMMVPAEDRKLVIAAAVAASANDEAGRKSVMEGLVEKFDRGLRGGMDSVVSIGERSQAIAVERAIAEGVEVPAEKAGTPEEYMEAVLQRVAGGDAYEVRAGVMKAVAGADFDKPSDEVKDQALAMIRENKDAIDLRDELRLAAENDIDPVTSEFLPVRGLYAAAESVPYMMTSMARGGWAINAMALAGDSYRSLRAANPTMTAEQAQTLSMLSGPFQAFIEKGQTTLALGQFKAVNRFFNQITRTKGAVASRFLTRTAATAGLEMVQENVQDLTPFVLQGLLSALDEDMPEVPWGPVYGDLLKQQPELFFAVLPLAVIGGGAGTYSDFKGGAELLTSYDLLRATGLSEAAASEVRALASQGNVEGAQTLLRQEFKTLGQDQKSVQEARDEAIPRMIAEREAMQQALNEAGELDILPAILREGEKYTLRYSGGEAVQYDSHAEAFARFEAVASSAVAALHEDMITAARMTTSQIERGREVKFIVSPLRPTTEDMEAQGVATGEDMAQRMEISEADKALTPKTEERKAKAMAGMVANSPEARTAVNYILGSATTSEAAPDSFGDRVVRNTVRLYQGATPFTLFEETAEGDAKFMIRELGLRRWMIGALRQWEATSGDTLFRASIKEESQIKDQDIVEAYSKMVQGYLAGRSKSGDQGRVFSSRFRKSIADALRGDFGAVLTGYASLFEAVYRRAAMIEKARRDGTFDGDLEDFLARSTGISEQRLFERDVVREASAIAQDLSGNPDFSSADSADATFSLLPSPKLSATDTEYLAAVERGDMETAQRMVDEAARAAGYDVRAYHGTSDYGFTVFDSSKLGGKTGAASAKRAFFFTSRRDVAESYTYLGEGDLFVELQAEFDDLSRQMDALMAESMNRDLDDLDDLSEQYNALSTRRNEVASKLHTGRMARGSVIDAGGVPEKAPGAGVYSVYLRMDAPIEVDFKGDAQRPETFADLIDRADSIGRDAVIIRNTQDNATVDAAGIISDVYAILANPGGRRVQLPQGEAAGIVGGAQILSGASRIKSADPVTFDESGAVIPLSQRFNPARDEITYSLLPDASNLDTEFARMFSPFQRSPELRMRLGQEMQRRVAEQARKLAPILRAAARTKASIEREAKVREAFEYDRLLRETFGADTQLKQETLPPVDTKAARSEARRLADQFTDEKLKEKKVADRETLLGFLRALEAIKRALPEDVRNKIGGSVALAKLVTPAAMLDEIESRVERIDVELERYLKKEADDRRKALFETAKPKREAGKKPKGKAGADIHDLFDRLKEALLWDGDQAEAWATMLEDRIGKGELSAEAEAHAKIEANLVRLFSDWKNADAARRTAAVDAGEEVWRVGYLAEKERIAQERERRAEVRAEIIAGTGKLGSRPERVVKAQQDAGLSGQWKEWFLSLFNFEQVAGFAMGAESKWTLWFSDAQREAEAKKLDEVQAVLDGLDELFRELGGSRLGGEKLQWKLSQPSFETKAGGKMSELEGVTALLMWRQEDGKRHMRGKRDENGKIVSAWSYDETFIAEIEKNLSTEALAVMDYLTDQYAGEYETLNPIFRELNGINLPRNDKYSPLTVKPQQAPGGQTTDPVTGSTMSNGSMTPGSLRTRAQVVAEPDFRNAVEVFVGHKKQLAHWKAYAVFSRDAQAILGNREVGNAIEAASGQEAAKVLRSWLDLFAQGGVRDAGSHLALTKALGAAMGRASAVQLVGRLGTLAIQTTQLGAAAAKMPVRDYIVRLSKLLTGNLGWGEALNSPYIQRRLAQMPASVQVAMEGLRAGKPNMIKHAAQRVGRLLSGTDALFTAGTYAMVFDYQLTKATKAGVDPVTAAEIARNEAERIVDEIAQPTRQGTRSLFEATATNPLGRVAWAFASEARKNMALVAYTGGKRPSGDLARALLYVIVFNGVLSALIRTAWRDLRDDEEGEDEWGMRRILLSVASEPLYGFPGFGEIAQDAIFAAAGEWKPSGSILDAPVKAPAAIVRAPENFGMVLEGDFEQPLRDLETMLMAGGLFNDTIAGLASFSHVLRDAESLIRNFIPDTP